MKIVYLDAKSVDTFQDMNWELFDQYDHFTKYELSQDEQVVSRSKEAEILLINKIRLDAAHLASLPKLKCICVTATGYDIVDIEAASSRKIPVFNVIGYSTPAVAQHVFSLLLNWYGKTGLHIQSVKDGDWQKCPDFAYSLVPTQELEGKKLGLLGFGKIARAVAKIALSFNMDVSVWVRDPSKYQDASMNVSFKNLDQLLKGSDIVSIHIPLSNDNEGFVNRSFISKMKKGAIFINTARGALVNEKDLYQALKQNHLEAALLDVVSKEPPEEGNLLFTLENCWITPHNSWMTRQSRQRLLDITANNIELYRKGDFRNCVNAHLLK